MKSADMNNTERHSTAHWVYM